MMAPCPTTALTSSKCHNPVKNKKCSTCYVPLHFLQCFKKISETISSYGGHTNMTWITIDNVQRVVTPKAGNLELQVLSLANCIMVINICTKFQENISKQFPSYTEWKLIYYRNHYFQSSKGLNSKRRLTRVTVLVFCTSSHDA